MNHTILTTGGGAAQCEVCGQVRTNTGMVHGHCVCGECLPDAVSCADCGKIGSCNDFPVWATGVTLCPEHYGDRLDGAVVDDDA